MTPTTLPVEQRPIAIIGGGLAGLAAAWELVEAGRATDVTVYEREDRLGGRVHTVDHDGLSLELGGFMVFPWYREVRSLLRACALEEELVAYRTTRQYFEQPDGSYQGHARTPLRQLVPLRVLARLAPTYLAGRLNPYEPDLTVYRTDTSETLYRRLAGPHEGATGMLNTLFTGYTYAEIEQLPAPVYLPLAPLILLHRGFDRVCTLPGGTRRLIEAMATRARDAGVQICTGARVVACDDTTITVAQGDQQRTMAAEAVIHASGMTDPLLYEIIPEARRPARACTHHWTVVWETPAAVCTNGDADWVTTYNAPRSDDHTPRIACYGHLSALQDLDGHHIVVGYLRIHPDDTTAYDADTAAGIATAQLHQELEVPPGAKVVATREWRPTMPITNVELLETLRVHDGRNSRWIAGDHLGPPSMEQAAFTGRAAAKRLLGTLR